VDFRRPFLTITPTLDGGVLAALAAGEVELSGRELARHVGYGSVEGIRRAADRLVAQGTVSRRAAGGAHLYSLNREHLAARHIEGLANIRGELIERLRAAIADWEEPPRLACLFGSVARSEAGAESDLDLLVVRGKGSDPDSDRWREQLLELQRSATAWTGNDARVVEYSEQELEQTHTDPLLSEVVADGIELYGSRRTLKRLISPVRGG
jgi:predicted nucleotidyltransferase